MNWIQQIITGHSGLFPGANPENIAEIERIFNISLPVSHKQFLQAVDGGKITEYIIVYSAGKGVQPSETLLSANANREDGNKLFFIAREAEEEFVFKREDMNLTDPPVYIYFHDSGEIAKVSDAFTQFIKCVFSEKTIKTI